MPSCPSPVPALLAAALVLATLQGCGRRGPLESPAAAVPAGGDALVTAPVGAPRAKRPVAPAPPSRPFVLDPLL